MSEAGTETPLVAPPGPGRGWPVIAWVIILGLIGLIVWRNGRPSGKGTAQWLVPMQMQARYLVGAANSGLPAGEMYRQAEQSLNRGSYGQRLRFVVLAGELNGPKEALRLLNVLRTEEFPPSSPEEAKMTQLLEHLYHLHAAGKRGPDESEKAAIRGRLGWFGELALAPKGGDPTDREQVLSDARRTFLASILIGLLALVGVGIGVVLLVLLGVLHYLGLLGGRGVERGGNGGIYAETFALYMALFIGMSYLSRFLPERIGGLWLSGIIMLLSLTALVWPVVRGVRWEVVRGELGLGSKQPLRDLALGVGTYVSALPLLGLGILVMMGLMYAQKRLGLSDPAQPGGPSHPIVAGALSGAWWVWLQMLILASVLAPLVEETMFRGALYQHLREIGPNWARWVSVAFSTLVSGLVFAVIHPQGWLGVPPLFALATAFALAREWRGSLLPGMVAHGINNGMTLLFLFVLTR